MPNAGDRDIHRDIVARLIDIGDFDAVEIGHPKEFDEIFPADRQAVTLVTPIGWDELDDADSEEVVRKLRYTLTLAVREHDPELRYELLDRFANAAADALDGRSLADLTEPAFTKLRQGRYGDPTGPEQRITIAGEAQYRVIGFDTHDED